MYGISYIDASLPKSEDDVPLLNAFAEVSLMAVTFVAQTE